MVSIAGTYQYESQENFEDLLKSMGINATKRSVIAATTPTIEISFDGTIFKEVVKTKLKSYTMECHLGRQFVHDAIELGGSMSLISTLDNDMIITRPVDGTASVTRRFTDDGMVKIMEKNGVIAKRTFKRI